MPITNTNDFISVLSGIYSGPRYQIFRDADSDSLYVGTYTVPIILNDYPGISYISPAEFSPIVVNEYWIDPIHFDDEYI